MLRDLMASVSSVDHPFMKPGRAGAPLGVIVMTSDKGLAGAFNSNLIRQAENFSRENASVQWYSVGIKGRNALRRQTGPTEHFWPLTQGVMLDVAREVAHKVTDDFVTGKISGITLISPKLINTMSQKPQTRAIVPIVPEATESKNDAPKGAVEFAPSPEAVLSRLLPKYLEFTIYSAMLETNASFFAAQLVAMSNASDNAKKLIDESTITMNNARQAQITTEILEIVGGAEALSG
jgi:F-type H+-transporting ATPase subunit gamma